ncbi:hypothetical protein CC2G_001395 [Coprinopsis cinerea AmutBmut pab1-1]|nr:hypothetical protein CC2G_001395 [Coprinopsis cinerea AmutBmut pab1-1]
MLLRSISSARLLRRRPRTSAARLATVSPHVIPQTQPPPPPKPAEPFVESSKTPFIDSRVLRALTAQPPATTLHDIISHYLDETGNVLDVTLPYEPTPSKERRVQFDDDESSREVVTVAHCAKDGDNHKVTLSSGFGLNVPGWKEDETLIVTCAHTLEEIRQSPLLQMKEIPPSNPHPILTGTFICIGSGASLKVYPASRIVSALPRSDIVLLSVPLPPGTLKSLPLSPYPAPLNTPILAHFVSPTPVHGAGDWKPWIGDTYGAWKHGRVVGYRDFSGRETQPGTYDALSHMLFTPFPTAGSSGGPVVDAETGAVVGVMLGSRMDNAIAGVKGWGVPSETIFEMFSLPGLEGKK